MSALSMIARKSFNGKFTAKINFLIGYFMLPLLMQTLKVKSLSIHYLQVFGPHTGQFQVTVFSRFCYVLLCNHEYIHCLNHRQAKDYVTRRNETERKLKFERRHW